MLITDVLRAGNSFATFQRVSGDNIRNYGRISAVGQITRLFGIEVGYANAYYNYDDTDGTAASPSIGGLLNRMEHTVTLDTRWQIGRTLLALGELAAARHNTDEARSLFTRALSAFEEMRAAPDVNRARAALALLG